MSGETTQQPCPYHSNMENGMKTFPPSHPCFTVYDRPTPDGGDES